MVADPPASEAKEEAGLKTGSYRVIVNHSGPVTWTDRVLSVIAVHSSLGLWVFSLLSPFIVYALWKAGVHFPVYLLVATAVYAYVRNPEPNPRVAAFYREYVPKYYSSYTLLCEEEVSEANPSIFVVHPHVSGPSFI
eukprot:GHVU01096300.1.p2 GENE.GHVU01096300.1~~GHVU01096300.1.p2  ORF type:complete len:137 (-),score=10.23 GHVU01096300.1:305-715(-)